MCWERRAGRANPGGGLVWGGVYDGSGSLTHWAALKAGKDNATTGEYGGYLSLWTRPNGLGELERIRIKSDGNVGIGTTTVGSKLVLDLDGAEIGRAHV